MVYGIDGLIARGLPVAAVEHPVTFWRSGQGKLHLSQTCARRRRGRTLAQVALPLTAVRSQDELCVLCGGRASAEARLDGLLQGCHELVAAREELQVGADSPLGRARTYETRARRLGWYATRLPGTGFGTAAGQTRATLHAAARDVRAKLLVDADLWAEAVHAQALADREFEGLADQAGGDPYYGRWALRQAMDALVPALLDQQPWAQAENAARAAAEPALAASLTATGADLTAWLEDTLGAVRSALRAAHGTADGAPRWALAGWWNCPGEQGLASVLAPARPVVDDAFGPAWRLVAQVPGPVAAALGEYQPTLPLVAVEDGDTPEVLRTAMTLLGRHAPTEAFRVARLIHAPAA